VCWLKGVVFYCINTAPTLDTVGSNALKPAKIAVKQKIKHVKLPTIAAISVVQG
jgi:hypothetical protein